MKAASDLSESLFYIDDTPGISALELRTKARRLEAETRAENERLAGAAEKAARIEAEARAEIDRLTAESAEQKKVIAEKRASEAEEALDKSRKVSAVSAGRAGLESLNLAPCFLGAPFLPGWRGSGRS